MATRQTLMALTGAVWARRGPALATAIFAVVFASCAPESPSVACAECEIQLVHVVTLGGAPGDGEIWGYPSSVIRDSRGRFYVAPTDLDPGPPLIFDQKGRFIARLGEHGSGPGQFERVGNLIVGTGDTLYVSDQENQRLTVMDPDYGTVMVVDYTAVTDAGSFVYFGASLETGSLVLNNADYEPGTLPFVMVDSRVAPVRSFGTPAPEWSQDDHEAMWLAATSMVRLVAPARGGGFWSIPALAEPTLDRWSDQGELVASVPLPAEWWAPLAERPTGIGVPQATATGLWEDRSGMLWTVTMVPSPDWEENRGKVRNIYASYENHELFYDAIIETIDPASGDRIASARLRNVPGEITVAAPGLLATRRPLKDGRWLVEIWRVRGPAGARF